jgi:hypothetical protein
MFPKIFMERRYRNTRLYTENLKGSDHLGDEAVTGA